jgi:predicted ATPase/DNA-binding winged helix-turn-helix (wHTH) protein
MPDESIRLVHASGECEIDLARRELRVLGSPVPVGARAFEIIEVLARSAGEIVTKDELMDRIWPGTIVSENTLQVHTVAVRKALGPYRSLLKTESGRGYRLLGDWTVQRHDAARAPVGLQRMRVDGSSPVTNFPTTVTRLIGRTAAVGRLRNLISAYRVVTLTGPGGIGKSSLALKVARGVLGEFADGGWLVELASLSDPALVPTATAGALRLPTGPNSTTPEAVARAIGDKKLLLVLDNCEHLVGAVATLAETLLALCPRTAIVTTSRETLRIQGEYVYRVPPLEVPDVGQIESAQILGHSAPELFITRAREINAGLVLNDPHSSMIAAICRRLDGIPLAIEFAAARAAALGVEQVAIGLRDRFALLTSGRRTALPRHRTLRATLDWSYQLLTTAERALLCRLSIFVGPFSLDAAGAVADAGVTASDVADGVSDLIAKSLVFKTADPVVAEFRLLETTRAYAFDRLREGGALAGVARRHAEYLLQVLGDIEEEQRSKPPDEYLVAIRRRADEIHAALDWAFSVTGDPAIGVALTIAAVPLWFELFQMTVARGRVEHALPHARTGSDQEMRLRIALGHAIWYSTGESDAIERSFARALEIAERVGASAVRTRALWGLWAARRSRGDYPAALEVARRYADAAVGARDLGAIHLADRILGLTHHILGHQTLARDYTERALRQPHSLETISGIGYQVQTAVAMAAQLARIQWMMGFPDQAMVLAEEAVSAGQKSGQVFPLFYALIFGALPVALWTGAMDMARRQVDILANISVGNQRMEFWSQCFARALKLRAGNDGEVLITAFIEARLEPAVIPPFADVASDASIVAPLPGPESADVLWNTPELLRVDALLHLWHDAPGAVTAAETQLRRAMAIAQEQGALSWELRAATSLARILRDRGDLADAVAILRPVYDRFTEGFDTTDLKAAKALLDELC